MFKPSPIYLLIGSLLLFLGACATEEQKPEMEEIVEQPKPQPVEQPVVEVQEEPEVPEVPEAPSFDETMLQVRTFYFDYDQADLRDLAVNALDVHAENILTRLSTTPNLKVVVEGHADERGTIDYNNALGNRRAEAVARYLRVKGVPARNIDVISYGELRPISDENNESAWKLNRRAVLNY